MEKLANKLLLAFAVLMFVCVPADAQSSSPESAATDFYKWYVRELNADRFPVQRQRTKIRSKVSRRLGRWLYSKDAEDFGADYFLSAQDWDAGWAKSVTAKKTGGRGNKAILRISFGPSENFGNHQVDVTMVMEGGIWKIDTVDPIEEP